MFKRRKIDVLALSETKLKGRGEVLFGEITGRVSGVVRGEAREGVGLLLSERLLQSVVEWKEESSRLMWVRVRLGRECWAFVSAYGPGSENSREVVENFWNCLSVCVESLKKKNNVVVLGDLNARVGSEVMEGICGKYGVAGRNESGDLFLNICREHELVVGNTFFKKRLINKYTWERVNVGKVVDRALMDYVVIEKTMLGRLKDVHVFRGEAGGISDHFLVEAKLEVAKGWRNKRGGSRREVVKVEELNKAGKEQEYQERLKIEYERVRERENGGVEEEWKMFRDTLLSTASDVCGKKKVGGYVRKGSEWWDEEVKIVVEEKRRAFEEWLGNRDARTYERYRQKRCEVKRKVKEAKRRADWRWGQKIGENFEQNKKMFWKEVKRLRKGESGREETVKDASGNLLKGDAARVRWAEYFESLLNVEDEREARICAVAGVNVPVMGEENEREVTVEEVRKALNGTKAGKAPGVDGCRPEFLKKGGVSVIEWLVRLFNICMVAGVVPVEWCSACIVPLYKGKGDRHECGNSRGISLLSVVGKVYGRVLIERIRRKTDDVVSEVQGGFRQGRGCVDQVFVVRQVCEKYLAKGKDVYWAFMDLEKAYDRVDREAMWDVLRLYGVGGKLLRAVKSFYIGSKACVRVGNELSEWFPVKVGLRQGCVMSPWLFNLYIDGVVREVNARVMGRGLELNGGGGMRWELCQLLFADDTALVADTEEKLRTLVREFGRVCDRRKLRVNVSKSKVMKCTRRDDGVRMDVQLNGEKLEEVEHFKYLGATVAVDGGVEMDVSNRVSEGCKMLGGMKKIMKSRGLGMNVKRELYERVIVPTVMYGSELWGMRVAERQKVNVFEMKCLRSMAGVTRMDRVRNDEIRRRTGVTMDLACRVDRNVLRWFGHMERMDGGCLTKRVMEAGVDGRAWRGRRRTSWMHGVKSALSTRGLSVEAARVRARDRDEWRAIVTRL